MNKRTIAIIILIIILVGTVLIGNFFFMHKNDSQDFMSSGGSVGENKDFSSNSEAKNYSEKNGLIVVQEPTMTGLPNKEVVYAGKNDQGMQMVWDLDTGSKNGLPGSLGYESVSNVLPYQYIDYLALVKNNFLFFYNVHTMGIYQAKDIILQPNQKIFAYPSVTENDKYYAAIIDQNSLKVVRTFIVNLSQKKFDDTDSSNLALDACIAFDSSSNQLVKWSCRDKNNGAPVYSINLSNKEQKTAFDFSSVSFNNKQPSSSVLVFPYFILVYRNNHGEDEISYMNLRNLSDIRKITMPLKVAMTIKKSYASDDSLANSFNGDIVGINEPYKTVVIVDKKGFMRFYRYGENSNVEATRLWDEWKFVTISQDRAYYTFQNGVLNYISLETWKPNGM